MEKLNIAELLRGCPTEMELDCTCADNVAFDKIIEYDQIKCVIGERREPLILDKYGSLGLCCPKCVIFPKGKTTWEGFQRPFKDGDVVAINSGLQVFILQRAESNAKGYCYIGYDFKFNRFFDANVWGFERLATEEEKQALFKAIKDNGYKWNPETKTLEELIEPKFKVGNRIKGKINQVIYTITDIRGGVYIVHADMDKFGYHIPFSMEKNYELVPNKFDITTLKAFDRVLVKCGRFSKWSTGIFSHTVKSDNKLYFIVNTQYWEQCIPYEGNEYLRGTTDDCEDFYKTWE